MSGRPELDPRGFSKSWRSGLRASDPDDLAVLLSAALNAAGVEHYVVVKFDGRSAMAIELRRGRREEGFGGVLIASLACGPADIGEANGLILADAIEAAGKL